jgi:hypothetical protein
MKRFAAILFLMLLTVFARCRNVNTSQPEWSEVKLKHFKFKAPMSCSAEEYSNEDVLAGDIKCSRIKLHYQFGSMINNNIPKGESANNYEIEKDSLENYIVRTLAWPKDKKGSIILMLDDMNPKFDEGEYRLVHQLNVLCADYAKDDFETVVSILKSIEID